MSALTKWDKLLSCHCYLLYPSHHTVSCKCTLQSISCKIGVYVRFSVSSRLPLPPQRVGAKRFWTTTILFLWQQTIASHCNANHCKKPSKMDLASWCTVWMVWMGSPEVRWRAPYGVIDWITHIHRRSQQYLFWKCL